MRMMFGVLTLLVALAVVAYLVKTPLTAAAVAPGAGAPAGTPAPQSKQIQRQVQDDIGRAMQQGADRAASAAP